MMTSLSIYLLLQRHRKTLGRTITFSYIAFMMLVTIASFAPSWLRLINSSNVWLQVLLQRGYSGANPC
jgi:hypothetical protein